MTKQKFFAFFALVATVFALNINSASAATSFLDMDTQGVSESKLLIGGRGAIGGATYFGVSTEYLFMENLGVIMDIRRGSDTIGVSFGSIGSETTVKSWTVGLQAAMHMDVLKVQNLDTYVSVGLARNFYGDAETTVTGAPGIGTIGGVSVEDSFDFVANVNARYFFTDNFAAHTSIGVGLGLFSVGADYMF